MQVQLKNILQEAKEQLLKASSIAETEEIRVKLLGKKGSLTEILRSMGSLKPEERKEFGKAANSVRAEIEGMLENKFKSLKELQKKERFAAEKIDVTEPGAKISLGVKHPISITIDEISRVFMSMGFSIAEGPEVETVFNNFDALNVGPNHPSRDFTDTFYISESILLRTQTSPVQVRTLVAQEPPIKIISPGRCFRSDTDIA